MNIFNFKISKTFFSDKPGPSRIDISSYVVTTGDNVTLMCVVDDFGMSHDFCFLFQIFDIASKFGEPPIWRSGVLAFDRVILQIVASCCLVCYMAGLILRNFVGSTIFFSPLPSLSFPSPPSHPRCRDKYL